MNTMSYKIGVTLEQVCLDKSISVKYKRSARCKECSGCRTCDGSLPVVCFFCKGRGQIRQHINLGGIIALPRLGKCEKCNGSGKVIPNEKKCKICGGEGKTVQDNKVVVKCNSILNKQVLYYENQGLTM